MAFKAQQTLICLLSAGIRNASQISVDEAQIEWAEVAALARENKVSPLLAHSLDSLGIEPPPGVQAALDQTRADCFAHSMAHIAAAVRLARNFHTHGIDVICVKGTARAFEVYKKWDVRFTQDIDLLVRRRDYREAANVLTSTGYDAPIPEDDVWWHEYLGESPYLPVAATGPTVDLHYKLHQPGTPALSGLDALLDHRVMRDLGQFAIPMLNKRDAMMLTATGFGKAIRARQPWISYAHEIAFALANDPEMRGDILDDYARECGMSRLWLHAKSVADAVFGPEPESGPENTGAAAMQTLTQVPALKPEPAFLYRSRLLWRWSEGVFSRPLRFIKEFIWVTLAGIQHDLFADRHSKR